jgi:hypothetical protein
VMHGMRKWFRHVGALAVAVGLLAAGSATAATVMVTPGGPTTGTAGASQFRFSTVARTINCTTTSYTARYVSGTFTGVTLPFAISTNLQPLFSLCRITGGLNTTVLCPAATSLNITAGLGMGRAAMTLTSFSCTVSIGTTCSVRIGGSVTATHDDATGTLRVSGTGQSLAATGSTNGSGGTCTTLPNDPTMTFLDATGTDELYTESPRQSIG